MSYPPLRSIIMTGSRVSYQGKTGYVTRVVSAAGGIYKNAVLEVEFDDNSIAEIRSMELTKIQA